MNDFSFTFHGADLIARGSGALWWPATGTLVVSDLHLGKSERMARRGGALLPPYESRDTLARLEAELTIAAPCRVICLGDSFDDSDVVRGLAQPVAERLHDLCTRCDWIWVEGNHDPGPSNLPGRHCQSVTDEGLSFRHIATKASGEISGHFHPKARVSLKGGGISRPCFLLDRHRLILPAFGTYTGGLSTTAPALDGLMQPDAIAIMTGKTAHAVPMPRSRSPEGHSA